MEHPVKPIAGFVTRKHAARAIRPVGAGGEPQDEDARVRIPKARDGPAPIFPIEIGTALDGRNVGAMIPQTGAPFAGDDLVLNDFEQYEPNLIYLLT